MSSSVYALIICEFEIANTFFSSGCSCSEKKTVFKYLNIGNKAHQIGKQKDDSYLLSPHQISGRWLFPLSTFAAGLFRLARSAKGKHSVAMAPLPPRFSAGGDEELTRVFREVVPALLIVRKLFLCGNMWTFSRSVNAARGWGDGALDGLITERKKNRAGDMARYAALLTGNVREKLL